MSIFFWDKVNSRTIERPVETVESIFCSRWLAKPLATFRFVKQKMSNSKPKTTVFFVPHSHPPKLHKVTDENVSDECAKPGQLTRNRFTQFIKCVVVAWRVVWIFKTKFSLSVSMHPKHSHVFVVALLCRTRPRHQGNKQTKRWRKMPPSKCHSNVLYRVPVLVKVKTNVRVEDIVDDAIRSWCGWEPPLSNSGKRMFEYTFLWRNYVDCVKSVVTVCVCCVEHEIVFYVQQQRIQFNLL